MEVKMKIFLMATILIFSKISIAETLSGKYELKESKIDYLVKYLIKKADGESTKAQGKGECSKEKCEFLVAAPIKTFESKDSNRDLNMLTTTKADKFPLVVAKIVSSPVVNDGKILLDLEIDFVGVKKHYEKVPFTAKISGDLLNVEGHFDLMLDEHKVEKPSLLGVNIEKLVPISITASWKKN
jgi:hypothetical protein